MLHVRRTDDVWWEGGDAETTTTPGAPHRHCPVRADTVMVLVLGGTRSGKSAVAETVAGSFGRQVTYVATAAVDPDDADHRARIERHRARRPSTWTTCECAEPGDLPRHLARTPGPVLVDSLGTWVAGHPDLAVDTAPLLTALAGRSGPTVVVSEEVGLSVHPPYEAGRRFADTLGELNQEVAAIADRVLLVVAGRALELPTDPPSPGAP